MVGSVLSVQLRQRSWALTTLIGAHFSTVPLCPRGCATIEGGGEQDLGPGHRHRPSLLLLLELRRLLCHDLNRRGGMAAGWMVSHPELNSSTTPGTTIGNIIKGLQVPGKPGYKWPTANMRLSRFLMILQLRCFLLLLPMHLFSPHIPGRLFSCACCLCHRAPMLGRVTFWPQECPPASLHPRLVMISGS